MFLRFIFKKNTKNFFSGLSGLARNLHLLEWEIKKKTKTAGEPSRLSCGTTIIQQIYDYGWGCSIGALERHTPNALYLLFFKPFPYFSCLTQFRIVGIANNVRYMGDFPCKTIINGKPVYNRLLIQPIR